MLGGQLGLWPLQPSASVGKPGGVQGRAPPGPVELGDVTSRRTRFFINETGQRGRMRDRPLPSRFPLPFPSRALNLARSLSLSPGRGKDPTSGGVSWRRLGL